MANAVGEDTVAPCLLQPPSIAPCRLEKAQYSPDILERVQFSARTSRAADSLRGVDGHTCTGVYDKSALGSSCDCSPLCAGVCVCVCGVDIWSWIWSCISRCIALYLGLDSFVRYVSGTVFFSRAEIRF